MPTRGVVATRSFACSPVGAVAVIEIERTLRENFPDLARKPGGGVLVRSVARIAGEDTINRFIAEHRHLSGFSFIERLLAHFHFTYRVSSSSLQRIPAEGRVIVVANHPIGSLDGLALLKLVHQVRPDVRIVASQMLLAVDPLRPLMLAVDNLTRRGTARGQYHRIVDALEADQAVIVFPAGEVSRIAPHGVRDGAWKTGFLRLSERVGAPVLPVYIGARNSALFYGLSALYKPLGTLMLSQEMMNKHHKEITFTVGELIPAAALGSATADREETARRLRRHVYHLRKRRGRGPRRPPVFPTCPTIAHPVERRALKRALYAAELLGETGDGKKIFLYDFEPDSVVVREIGRLRELTFRHVGEGIGAALDVSPHDSYYRHLVLWDDADLEIVGAYRIGEGRAILDRHGVAGFYTNTLFEFQPGLIKLLPDSLEMGRSFVQPRYWGRRSLDELWCGIGAYLVKHPHIRHLFGPVSISGTYPPEARDLVIAFYARQLGASPGLASARHPFTPGPAALAAAETAFAGDYATAFKRLKAALARFGCTVPTLYKQYGELCDDRGCRFVDFHVDPDFGHCIDSLILVDVAKISKSRRKRYMGGHPGNGAAPPARSVLSPFPAAAPAPVAVALDGNA
jgi:putative hemolysin